MNLKDDTDALFHSKMAACAAMFKPMQVAIKFHDQQAWPFHEVQACAYQDANDNTSQKLVLAIPHAHL